MTFLTGVYTVVGIFAGLGTVLIAARSIARRAGEENAKILEPIVRASQPLAEAVDRLDRSLKGQRDQKEQLGKEVDRYWAVQAANNALQAVIADSTQQLSEAATQLAKSTEMVSATKAQLASALERIVVLENQVAQLQLQLAKYHGTTQEQH